jgi:hypothetical protein
MVLRRCTDKRTDTDVWLIGGVLSRHQARLLVGGVPPLHEAALHGGDYRLVALSSPGQLTICSMQPRGPEHRAWRGDFASVVFAGSP